MQPPTKSLSVSQIQVIQRCPREYIFKYVLRYPDEKPEAYIFGSAFHKAMETGTLPEASLNGLNQERYPYRHAIELMASKTREALEAKSVKVIKAEYAINSTFVGEGGEDVPITGFIDKVAHIGDKWFIGEMKTAYRIDPQKELELPHDLQVNTYAAHRDFIAEDFFLDPKDFGGVLYITAEKPAQRRSDTQKKGLEPLEDFANRLTSRTEIWTIPSELFARSKDILKTAFKSADMMRKAYQEIYDKTFDPLKIPAFQHSCKRYGKPCPYYGTCYGQEALERLKTNSSNEARDSSNG